MIRDTVVLKQKKKEVSKQKDEKKTADLKYAQYTGKVYFKKRATVFVNVWIIGLDEHNKHISKKTETNYHGKYQINLTPGNYQIQVFGRMGEMAKVKIKVTKATQNLPDIQCRTK